MIEPADPSRGPCAGGDETVSPGELVVVADDEAPLRDLARRVLELGGFRVLTAADGWEAVARCEEHAGGVRAVLLDLKMPGPGTPSTVEALRRVAPAAAVVVSSGLSACDAADVGLGGAAFLAKPYSPKQLLQLVRDMTAGGRAASDTPAPGTGRTAEAAAT